jgi:hypothetical protein
MPTIASGDVLCLDGSAGTFFGTMDIPSEAHLVVFGELTIWGSITVRSGATVCRTLGTKLFGPINFDPGSINHIQNNACDNVGSCTAPSEGSITGEQSICSGGDPSTIGNTSDGGASTFEWE